MANEQGKENYDSLTALAQKIQRRHGITPNEDGAKSILSPTRRGNGDGASTWKSVKFNHDLPKGFPERQSNAMRLRPASHYVKHRGDDRSQLMSLVLVLLTLIFVVLTSQALEAAHAMLVIASK